MDKTFVKGLCLLELLAQNPRSSGVTEIAEKMGLNKSNAHRLLQTLVTQGYAVNVAGRYALTLKIWGIGVAVLDRMDVRSIAPPLLQELSALSGETVHLSILDGKEVVYIDKVESLHPIRAYSKVGGRAPAYAVATGKILIAHAAEELLESIGSSMQAYTATTISCVGELQKELAQIRSNGFAVNRGEWRSGVWGVGAPILDSSGCVTAAIGISGPAERVEPNVQALSKQVRRVAAAISLQLGYRGARSTAGDPSPLANEA